MPGSGSLELQDLKDRHGKFYQEWTATLEKYSDNFKQSFLILYDVGIDPKDYWQLLHQAKGESAQFLLWSIQDLHNRGALSIGNLRHITQFSGQEIEQETTTLLQIQSGLLALHEKAKEHKVYYQAELERFQQPDSKGGGLQDDAIDCLTRKVAVLQRVESETAPVQENWNLKKALLSVNKIVDGEDIKVLSENDPRKKGEWFKEFVKNLVRNLFGNNSKEVKNLSESTTSLFKDALSNHKKEPLQPMPSSVVVMAC
ncbi:hypothetical protein [Piscirickettsia salmonis]|uniref:hypothetical protein n=1 Tax=Piscirickettsia salmonis TaxID=1238 RepID=UPI0007D7760F|nr:hypothetical protein A0O36_01574 [Piscirickettsiaceae bacterium NZ-RLO1]